MDTVKIPSKDTEIDKRDQEGRDSSNSKNRRRLPSRPSGIVCPVVENFKQRKRNKNKGSDSFNWICLIFYISYEKCVLFRDGF